MGCKFNVTLIGITVAKGEDVQCVQYLQNYKLYQSTGVERNFDRKGPKMEKSCDVILVTFLDRNNNDVT